jgi:hypothetical protein
MDASKDDLKKAIETEHGGKATHHHAVPVNEKERGQSIWHGIVHVFDLADHPKAKRAYGWSTPVEGQDEKRIVTMLHSDTVKGPIEAVRAALAAELKEKHGHNDVSRNSGASGSPHRESLHGGRNPSAPARQRGRSGNS